MNIKKAGFANRILAWLLALCVGASLFLFWSVNTHAVNEIPAYSGSASVAMNNNAPEFTVVEITRNSFESYGDLDELGRCTTAVACIGQDLMPTEERQSIGDVRPTGWEQNKYPGLVESDPPFLYNRCHMIGFQLTGENANEKNLITGTRYMNVEGMLPYENEVADYIDTTGNHVMYRVTPVFTGNNLLCDGVQIEAYSVEDQGKGVRFNVFCYNVQPGVAIDYSDGSNRLAEGASMEFQMTGNDSTDFQMTGSASTEFQMTGRTVETENVERSVVLPDTDAAYVLNKNSHKFHIPSCDSVRDMKEKNKEYSNKSREEIMADGYDPCKQCRP